MTHTTLRAPHRWWALAGMLILALMVSACSGSDDEDTGGNGAAITVTHAKGTIELPAAPDRIVALGSGDVQIADGLGGDIVGAVSNPSAADKNWPGAALPESVMTLDSVSPNLEAIAALRPDVILATTAQQAYIDQYERLSQIAPTVVYKTEPFADSGDELVDLIGTALGKNDEAQKLIDSSNQSVAGFTRANPRIKGMTYAFGQYAGDQLYLLTSEKNPSTQFLTSLGLTLDPKVAELGESGTQGGFTMVSAENYSLLSSSQRVLVSTPGDEKGARFSSDPIVQSAFGDRLRVISTDLAGALLTANPATTDYLLEQLRRALT